MADISQYSYPLLSTHFDWLFILQEGSWWFYLYGCSTAQRLPCPTFHSAWPSSPSTSHYALFLL